VLRLLKATEDGSVTAEIKFTDESSESGNQVQTFVPLLEAQNRADAVAPGALQGAEIYKQFENKMWYKGKVGTFDSKQGWYRVNYDDGDSEEMDTEEILELLFKSMPSWDFCPPWQLNIEHLALKSPLPVAHAVAPLSKKSNTTTAIKQGLGGQKRQKVATNSGGKYNECHSIDTGVTRSEDIIIPSTMNINAGTSKTARDIAAPVISPPRVPHKYPLARAAPNAPVAVCPGSPPLAPSTASVDEEEPGIEAGSLPEDVDMTAAAGSGGSSGTTTATRTLGPATQLPVPSSSDIYAPCGAGHQRGAVAYDRHNKTFRAIGKWIIDKQLGTLLGRFTIDRRYLDCDEDQISCTRSSAVPGWLGVRGTFQTVEEEKEDGDGVDGVHKNSQKRSTVPAKGEAIVKKSYLGAPYTLVFYDTQQAKQCHLLYPTFATAEEAAQMYDQFALSLYDPFEVDLNYPLDPEARIEAANTWQRECSKVTGRKASVLLAIDILNFERSIPDAAVKVVTATEGTTPSQDWEKFEYV
jgi:hypothetical protein